MEARTELTVAGDEAAPRGGHHIWQISRVDRELYPGPYDLAAMSIRLSAAWCGCDLNAGDQEVNPRGNVKKPAEVGVTAGLL